MPSEAIERVTEDRTPDSVDHNVRPGPVGEGLDLGSQRCLGAHDNDMVGAES